MTNGNDEPPSKEGFAEAGGSEEAGGSIEPPYDGNDDGGANAEADDDPLLYDAVAVLDNADIASITSGVNNGFDTVAPTDPCGSASAEADAEADADGPKGPYTMFDDAPAEPPSKEGYTDSCGSASAEAGESIDSPYEGGGSSLIKAG